MCRNAKVQGTWQAEPVGRQNLCARASSKSTIARSVELRLLAPDHHHETSFAITVILLIIMSDVNNTSRTGVARAPEPELRQSTASLEAAMASLTPVLTDHKQALANRISNASQDKQATSGDIADLIKVTQENTTQTAKLTSAVTSLSQVMSAKIREHNGRLEALEAPAAPTATARSDTASDCVSFTRSDARYNEAMLVDEDDELESDDESARPLPKREWT